MKIQWSDFRAFSDNNLDDIPTKAGVYLLWMKLSHDDWRLFYVGEADSLRHTMKRHLTCQEPNLKSAGLRNCVTGFDTRCSPT